jgi:membrane dipeptidase
MLHLLRATIRFMVLAVLALSVNLHAQSDFRELHDAAIVVDGHNDVLMRVIKGHSIEIESTNGHSDLPRFKQGGLDVQLFSIWVPPRNKTAAAAWDYAVREIDSLDAITKRNPWLIEKTLTGSQLISTVQRKAIAAVYAIEGCHPAGGSLENIRKLYKKGVRVFGLCWNNSNAWAHSSSDESRGVGAGLKRNGRDLIELLDSLGAIIDISHTGEKSFWDMMEITDNPVIASHSACTEIRKHHRNLSDEQLRAIAAKGGVVMVNFFPGFIRSGMPKGVKKQVRAFVEELDNIEVLAETDSRKYLAQRDAIVKRAVSAGLPTLHDVADHIMHAVKICGAEHVGLGSDFDGIGYAPIGIHDATQYPYLTRELMIRGLSDTEIQNILGRNFVRIFSQVCR